MEKCRDAGITWCASAFSVWLWLFVPGSMVGWGSRKEMLVDNGAHPDSIFAKIRMIVRHLPSFLRPPGFVWRVHSTHMKLINPDNGSTIGGEAGEHIGRGGRSTMYFKDESAHYEHPELIEAALGDNTDVQIDISSVNGPNNVFYRRRMAGTEWHLGMNEFERGRTLVFVFDWRQHPGKDLAWYNARRKKAESEGLLHIFAQEVDRDYMASLERIIIPRKVFDACIDAHVHLGFKAEGGVFAAQDVADEGGDRHALAIRKGVVLRYGEEWGDGDGGEAARKAVPIALAYQATELYYDSIGVGAAFKAETNRLRDIGEIPQTLTVFPWTASDPPLMPDECMIPGDLHSRTNGDYFASLKSQAWHSFATRCMKTYKVRYHDADYPPEELVSIPGDLPQLNELALQLCQVTQTTSKSTGKMVIEKTPKGGKSPNLADAVVMCYHPTKEVSIFDAL